MIKIKLCVICLLWVVLFLPTTHNVLQTVHAATPTSSATQGASLKSKLKELQDEIASKAVQLKNEVSKKLQNKAYVGFIVSSSPTSLNIKTDIATKSAIINEFTQVVSKGKVISKIVVNDYIAALGDVDETGILTAKKIIKLTPPEPQEKKIIFGTVLSLDENRITIQNKERQNFSLVVNTDTIYKTSRGQNSAFDDIKLNQTIIALGLNPKNGVLKVRFIYLIPSGVPMKIKPKTATPSAKPT